MTGQAPDPGSGAGAAPARRCWRCSTCPSRTPQWAGPRPAPAPAADAGRGQAAAPAREPGPAAPPRLRGPPLDRRRDPGAARQPGREPADRAHAAPRQLPPRVPARLGEQDLLQPAPARPAAARERRGAARRAPGRGPALAAAQAAADRAHRGQPVLPGGERPHAGRDRCWSGSAAPIAWRSAPDASQVPATVQAILAARIDRLAARGEAPPPGGRGHRQGCAICAPPGDRRGARGRPAAESRDPPGRPSFSTRRASSPTSSTPSSTP